MGLKGDLRKVVVMVSEEMKTACKIIMALLIILGLIASPLGIAMLIMVTLLMVLYLLMLAGEEEKRKK